MPKAIKPREEIIKAADEYVGVKVPLRIRDYAAHSKRVHKAFIDGHNSRPPITESKMTSAIRELKLEQPSGVKHQTFTFGHLCKVMNFLNK